MVIQSAAGLDAAVLRVDIIVKKGKLLSFRREGSVEAWWNVVVVMDG